MTQRGDRTKARLVSAATHVVAEVGYSRATTRAIAAQAGVSEASIYRHFPDKRALFAAALLEGNQPVLEWMSDLPGRAGTGTLTENLAASLVQLSSRREAVLPLERAMLDDPEMARDRPVSDPMTLATLGGPPHQLQLYLEAEQQLGRVRPDVDAGEAAIVLLAALFGLATGPPLPGRTLAQSVTGAVGLVVDGIAT